ncbi:hypothetical protein Ocin01_14835 [Orchesella cincta]|uniref:Uncharacterized protein n=1 Tax=Orchesella cincta TaxID=48709 RepID=A0A1D2MFS1_ORCCI|nr:hypothetical protein Ocin01_14835 [Orchesella cincta]
MSILRAYLTRKEATSCYQKLDTGANEMVSLMPFSDLISFACNKELIKIYFSSSNFDISKTHCVSRIKEDGKKVLPNNICDGVPQLFVTNGKSIQPELDKLNPKEGIFKGEADDRTNIDRKAATFLNRCRMPLKRRYCRSQPVTFSKDIHERHENRDHPNVEDGVSYVAEKGKRMSENGGDDVKAVPNKFALLTSFDDTNSHAWLMKGVVVKTLKYGRPMGTILEVDEDKTTCTIHFFSGWKAKVFTKHIAPVLASYSHSGN